MTILTPLGLLGLIGIIILIIIYIIKPNYQQKYISSTYIWKLSLRYKKKRIPTSRLRDILLIICQILAITACALILATPSQILRQQPMEGEVIMIIDASASMRTTSDDQTRYMRAVENASETADKILRENGTVSLILANDKPAYLNKRASLGEISSVQSSFDQLKTTESYDPVYCSYGNGDIDAALELCEEVVSENPKTLIYIYTDKQYEALPANVRVLDVKMPGEWNAAILSAYTTFESGYYTLYVDVASYDRDAALDVKVVVNGANKSTANPVGARLDFEAKEVRCSEETTTVIFSTFVGEENAGESADGKTFGVGTQYGFYSYESILVYLQEDGQYLEDNYSADDNFNVYGGVKPTVKIMYYSAQDGNSQNKFVTSALLALRKKYADVYNIELDEQADEFKGYDMYIFEHSVPVQMPDDGVVVLLDPLGAPERSGFTLRGVRDLNKIPVALTENVLDDGRSPLFKNISVPAIEVTRYQVFDRYDDYTVIASVGDDPVILYRNEIDTKVFVMGFSVHFSNFPLLSSFPLMFNNMIEFFLPPTVTGNFFEVYSEITVNSQGNELNVRQISADDDEGTTFSTFPAKIRLNTPGTYNISQKGFLGKDVDDIQIYVKTPAAESNISAVEETVYDPFGKTEKYDFFKDLLVYVAAALVALLFIEWILQLRDNM
ncbi:MAG: VWA domain-containing protein [Candidatus Neoclostridium sp.]